MTCTNALVEAYDLAMLDLDGVVYVGPHAVPGAPEYIETARAAGMSVAFITNNASRTPVTVAEHLSNLGVPAGLGDVVTSAQAAASVLLERLGPGAPVAVLGAVGLFAALDEAGLARVALDDVAAAAVVSGYAPDAPWRDIMRVAARIRDGLWWVASNTDLTIPTPYGLAPGHGVLVETIQRFSAVRPVVAGKPARPLLDETIRRVGGNRPLMVGDRLDTDIAGARNAEIDSLLVLTGVTGLAELISAAPGERPTYLSPDLGGLTVPHGAPESATQEDGSQRWRLGGWAAYVDNGALRVDGAGETEDWWRVVAESAWAHLDRTGAPVGTAGLGLPDSR